MRNLFISLLLLAFSSFGLRAQTNHICGTTPWVKGYHLQKERLLQNIRRAASGSFTARNTIYVPIKFHVGANNDGSGRLNPQRVLDQLCELNEDFASLDIQFFLADGEINFINNTTFYANHVNTQTNVMSSQKDPRALNVFIVENANTGVGSGDNGIVLAYYIPFYDWIVITKTFVRLNDPTLAHEVGHFFSLFHTFNGWECESYNTEGVPAPSISSCGSVPTERANGSNCSTAGDFICDTPADYNNGIGWNSCNFTLEVQDPQGNVIDPEERNYLSYFLDCPDSEYLFSDQQVAVMEADIASNDRNYLFIDPVPDYVEINEEAIPVSPATDEVTEGYNIVNFEWESVEGATSYLFEVDRVSSFTINPTRIITSETSVVVETLEADKRYHWRVRPFNAHFACADNSEAIRFRTGENVVSTSTPVEVEAFAVAPNPVTNQNELNVYLNTTEAFLGQVNLLDINGRNTPIRQPFEFTVGENRLHLDLSDLPSGMYFLQIDGLTGSLIQKVILAR